MEHIAVFQERRLVLKAVECVWLAPTTPTTLVCGYAW